MQLLANLLHWNMAHDFVAKNIHALGIFCAMKKYLCHEKAFLPWKRVILFHEIVLYAVKIDLMAAVEIEILP